MQTHTTPGLSIIRRDIERNKYYYNYNIIMDKCDCDNCCRSRKKTNWICKIGIHKFEKGKYTESHTRSRYCILCEQNV